VGDAMSTPILSDSLSPVEILDTGSVHEGPSKGIALCLSGGGYRSMLFHLGSLWRIAEVGYLSSSDHTIIDGTDAGTLQRISSVSGGSITAAVLGQNWALIGTDQAGVRDRFIEHVVKPIRGLADHTIDVGAILGGTFLPGSINKRIIKAYRKHLYHQATLQTLPDLPRFVINATNLQSGVLWRFMKPYMRDWRVGEIKAPKTELAAAVAASSAFPPVLSPARFYFEEAQYEPGTGDGLQQPPFTTKPVLSDGGVYDNLGLETAWKRYKTVLVSDAGGLMAPASKVNSNWVSQAYRTLNVIDNQVRSLRKRQVIGSYVNHDREGAYWGIRTNISHYPPIPDVLPCPHEKTMKLADIATRLKKLDSPTQERLINWGYAVCDAALRAHLDPGLTPAPAFPYPDEGVG
jgi:NTE family protein